MSWSPVPREADATIYYPWEAQHAASRGLVLGMDWNYRPSLHKPNGSMLCAGVHEVRSWLKISGVQPRKEAR